MYYKGPFIVILATLIFSDILAQTSNGIAGSDKIHCFNGTPVYLFPDAGFDTYSWQPGSGLSDSTVENPIASPDSTTTYILTATQGTDTFVDSVTVRVVTNGQVLDVLGNDTTVCEGSELVYYSNFGVQGSFQIITEFDTSTYSSRDSVFIFAADRTEIVLVLTNTGCTVSDTLDINVYSLVDSVTVQSESCSGNDGSIEIKPDSTGVLPYTIQWSDTGSGFSRSFLESGSYGYTITNGIGCTKELGAFVAGTANSLEIMAQDTVLCNGESSQVMVQFLDTVSGSTSNNTSLQIGSDTSFLSGPNAYPAIYGNWFRSARHDMLYKASELLAQGGAAGSISSIAFDIAQINGTSTYCNFRIGMKQVARNQLPNSFDTGFTEVFPSQTVTIDAGWNEYTLQMPFVWDGYSNILVSVCFDKTSSTNSGNPLCDTTYSRNSPTRYSTTPFTSVLRDNSDATPQCGGSGGISPTASNLRPNVRFGMQSSTVQFDIDQVVWSPSTNLNDTTIVSPIIDPDSTTTYTLTITDSNGCTLSDSVTFIRSQIEIDALASDTILGCNDEFVVLTSNANAQYGIKEYFWNGLDDFQPNRFQPNVTGYMDRLDTNVTASIRITDSLGCMEVVSINITRPDSCIGSISGKVYYDKNINCVFDNDDSYMPNVEFVLSTGQRVFSDNQGTFTIPFGGTGSLTIEQITPQGFDEHCNPKIRNVNITTSGTQLQLADFADTFRTANPINDTTGLATLENVDLKLYPQPAKDQLVVESTIILNELIILDLLGREKMRLTANTTNRTVLDVSSLQQGTYLLAATTTNGGIKTQKITLLR